MTDVKIISSIKSAEFEKEISEYLDNGYTIKHIEVKIVDFETYGTRDMWFALLSKKLY